MRQIFCVFMAAMSLGVAIAPGHGADPPSLSKSEAERLFAQKVWPLLSARCLACHGGDPSEIAGGLDLRTRTATVRGGERGEPGIVPGKPDQGLLLWAVARTSDDLRMPPKEADALAPREVGYLRQWIAAGAPWPAADRRMELARAGGDDPWNQGDGVPVSTSGGLSDEWTNRRYEPEKLWAYRPLREVQPPGKGHPVDAFVERRLREIDLSPAPPANRRTLIRRLTYDLIGLAPTPSETAAFVADPAPDDQAVGRLIDRLLASPHYGEQMARHWLDVVRYADSAGLANDYQRGSAWRYRDYVIRSFNADKPYDRFVREQLAGDEIQPDDPEMLVAVGFLRMGPWELTGMEVRKIARQRFLDDVTDIVGQAFLAHPMQCARCHDHKFDPIPTRDYYALQACFSTTQVAEREAAFLAAENTDRFAEQRYLDRRRQHYAEILKAIEAKEREAAERWCAERGLEYVSRNEGRRRGLPEDQIPPRHVGLDPRDFGMERIARKGMQRLDWEFERYKPHAVSVYAGRTPLVKAMYGPFRMPQDRLKRGELENTAILSGGDPFSPTEPVKPGPLSAATALGQMPSIQFPTGIQGRRKALADWIAHPQNPLTVRVFVNRIWQQHFGRGLAAEANNFGGMGQPPTHPELLDWLASEFVRQGWSIKRLHRLILTSAAYRRASRHPDPERLIERDPPGTSLAIFRPRPLVAEELRDTLLSLSGELNPTLGGIPVRPEIHPEVALQPRQVMGTFAAAWEPSPLPAQRHRRSIYALRLRGLRDPQAEVFHQPTPDLSCSRREESTVTPQAFALLNSRGSYQRAIAWAARLLRETESDSAAIERAFHLAYSRPPTDAERSLCLQHWRQMTQRHQGLKFDPPSRPREVVREAVEENTGERFTFVEKLESAADFVPDLGPADIDARTRGLAEVCLVLINSNELMYLD